MKIRKSIIIAAAIAGTLLGAPSAQAESSSSSLATDLVQGRAVAMSLQSVESRPGYPTFPLPKGRYFITQLSCSFATDSTMAAPFTTISAYGTSSGERKVRVNISWGEQGPLNIRNGFYIFQPQFPWFVNITGSGRIEAGISQGTLLGAANKGCSMDVIRY